MSRVTFVVSRSRVGCRRDGPFYAGNRRTVRSVLVASVPPREDPWRRPECRSFLSSTDSGPLYPTSFLRYAGTLTPWTLWDWGCSSLSEVMGV